MNVLEFIQSFLGRKGLFVLSAALLAKGANFLVTIIVVNLLSRTEYGQIAYGMTILSFIAPFVGGGIFQGLLRYGALSKSQLEKKILFRDTFWIGLKYSAYMVLVLLLLSPLLTYKLPGALPYLIALSLQVFSLFAFVMIQVYCRLILRNQLFARIDIQNNLVLLLVTTVLCYTLGGMGYVISLILVPLLISLYYLRRLGLFPFHLPEEKINRIRAGFKFKTKELIIYGLNMSLGGLLSQLLFSLDIILIGNLLVNPEDLIANYKVASIIPYSLLILGGSVLTTDFVKLAGTAISDKKALQVYYLNYLKLFSVISLGILVFFYVFAEYLLGIFGPEYQESTNLLFIFAVGVIGGLLFRVPMGNMLSAIGWPKVNALFSGIILLINLVANYFMILRYGVEGAAITTAALMWLSGLLSLGAFVYFLKQ